MPRLSAALSSATQHAMPPEFGRNWGTECLNTRFPLLTLLCAGCSVKPILKTKNTVCKMLSGYFIGSIIHSINSLHELFLNNVVDGSTSETKYLLQMFFIVIFCS